MNKPVITGIAALLLHILLIFGTTGPVTALEHHNNISVNIDGLPVPFDAQPAIRDGRTLVPFRALAEALNVNVTWDAAAQTVHAKYDNAYIKLQIGNPRAYRNNLAVTLDVPPAISGGRTLIPLRFFSEAFGCKVKWDNTAYEINITSPPKTMAVIGFYALGDSETSSWRDLFARNYPDASEGNTGALSGLALGWYSLDEQGNLLTQSKTGWQRPEGWEKVLQIAGRYRLNSEMVVHLTDKDNAIYNLLNNRAAVTGAVNAIKKEALLYHGVNLDFEGLGWRDDDGKLVTVKNNFTQFVTLLASELKKDNLSLTLTLHAPNSAYQGYDYQALGKQADRIIIMAYDYGTKPEPVDLVIEAVERARSVVPSEKLVLGISIPGETPESLRTKIGIAKRYKLNGIALWRLGLLTDEMWKIIKQSSTPRTVLNVNSLDSKN